MKATGLDPNLVERFRCRKSLVDAQPESLLDNQSEHSCLHTSSCAEDDLQDAYALSLKSVMRVSKFQASNDGDLLGNLSRFSFHRVLA